MYNQKRKEKQSMKAIFYPINRAAIEYLSKREDLEFITGDKKTPEKLISEANSYKKENKSFWTTNTVIMDYMEEDKIFIVCREESKPLRSLPSYKKLNDFCYAGEYILNTLSSEIEEDFKKAN